MFNESNIQRRLEIISRRSNRKLATLHKRRNGKYPQMDRKGNESMTTV
jgi:hypothetical protein